MGAPNLLVEEGRLTVFWSQGSLSTWEQEDSQFSGLWTLALTLAAPGSSGLAAPEWKSRHLLRFSGLWDRSEPLSWLHAWQTSQPP